MKVDKALCIQGLRYDMIKHIGLEVKKAGRNPSSKLIFIVLLYIHL